MNKNQNIVNYCKLFGFLKYYHPAFTSGKKDWDQAFLAHYDALANSDYGSDVHINQYLDSLNGFLLSKNHGDAQEQALLEMEFKAISPSLQVQQKLSEIYRKRTCNARSFYVTADKIDNPKYLNEHPYEGVPYPTEALRVLALARFWNIIHYFSPYRQLTNHPWDSVLIRYVPSFIEARNAYEYSHCLRKLIVEMGDTHSQNNSVYPDSYTATRLNLPVEFTFIDKHLYVTCVYEVKPFFDQLNIGDEVTHIDLKPIDSIIDKWKETIPASNDSKFFGTVATYLATTKQSLAKLTIKRAGKIFDLDITGSNFNFTLNEEPLTPDKLIGGNIGYIALGRIKLNQINKTVRKYKACKGLIFDLRAYPDFTLYKICNLLSVEKKAFVQWTTPDCHTPGSFTTTYKYCGRNRKERPFQGRIAILVNEHTQSLAEFSTMALQTLPDAKVIGSQTAGTDGDVSKVLLPGGYYTTITGLGVSYPDGTNTQRKGVRIDIEARPTVDGIREKKDELIDRAISYINDGK